MGASQTPISCSLVRGTNWIGDAVMTTPALRRLRASFPAAHIILLATPRTAGLFESSAFIDEVLTYHRQEGWPVFVETVWALRRRRFDLALLFQNAFEAALLARLGGARLRVGYTTQGRSALLTHAIQRGPQHRTHRAARLDCAGRGHRMRSLHAARMPD